MNLFLARLLDWNIGDEDADSTESLGSVEIGDFLFLLVGRPGSQSLLCLFRSESIHHHTSGELLLLSDVDGKQFCGLPGLQRVHNGFEIDFAIQEENGFRYIVGLGHGEDLTDLKKAIQQRMTPTNVYDPCPWGSGKKYKFCCAKKPIELDL